MSTALHPDLLQRSTEFRGRDGHPYLPDRGLQAALYTAWTLQIPLLVTGEPGCGKTDLAYAAASWLHPGTPPLQCHVHSDSRARDLLYRYDAERRFGDAQHGSPDARVRANDARHYVSLRGLGLALMSAEPRVVLIDEIDKAPRDLPNDLLRELDEFHFTLPELEDDAPGEIRWKGVLLQREMKPPGERRPLVIITSNVERQLPDAFLRRCAFYHIQFPGPERLLEITRKRFKDRDPMLLERAVKVFAALRAFPHLQKKPATSELLQWVESLHTVYAPDQAAEAVEEAADAVGSADPPAWAELPGLCLLIKLREDLRLLGVEGA